MCALQNLRVFNCSLLNAHIIVQPQEYIIGTSFGLSPDYFHWPSGQSKQAAQN